MEEVVEHLIRALHLQEEHNQEDLVVLQKEKRVV
tara:strand:- start:336 stop:437 length:102 start_codon:yes stop_codon:yes gene_type:complete